MENRKEPPPASLDSISASEIKLEEAKAKRVEAERRLLKETSREAIKQDARNAAKGLGPKGIAALLLVVALVAFILVAFVIPSATSNHENHYLSESDLKAVVDIDNLSTIDYIYHGVAEKHDQILWQDKISYRVKYEARVRAGYNLGDIEFRIDEDNKTVTAYLPEAAIADPQIDYNKLDFLPANATANMNEVIRICREDASAEVNREEIQREASASLQNTVNALTTPLIEGEYTLEFESIANLPDSTTSIDDADSTDVSSPTEEAEDNE